MSYQAAGPPALVLYSRLAAPAGPPAPVPYSCLAAPAGPPAPVPDTWAAVSSRHWRHLRADPALQLFMVESSFKLQSGFY